MVSSKNKSERINNRKKASHWHSWIVFVFPFILNYRIVITEQGRFLPIGNDFSYLYYVYKPYLLSNLSQGRFPLWMPQEASGFDFAVNPFTQTFYPLNLLLALFTRYTGNWGIIDQQRYTILGLSIFSLAFYFILKKVQVNKSIAVFVTILTTSSYKIIEIVRFTNAVHAIACATWIICSLIYVLAESNPKRKILWTVSLTISTIGLAFAGYPYFLVYFLIVLPGTLMFIFTLLRVNGLQPFKVLKSTLSYLIISASISVVVTGPYILSMFKTLQVTNDRSGGNWSYATMHRFGPNDYVGSFILPNRATFEGWFYFGTLASVLFLTVAILKSKKNPRKITFGLATSLFVWFLNIVFFGLSASNPLFKLLWENFELIQSLRVWSRINIFLIIPIGIGIALALGSVYESYLKEMHPKDLKKLLLTFVPVCLAVLIIQFIFAASTEVHSDIQTYLVPAKTIPVTEQYFLETFAILVISTSLLIYITSRANHALGKRQMESLRATTWLVVVSLGIFWIGQSHGFKFNGWMWTSNSETTIAELSVTSSRVDKPSNDLILQQSLSGLRRDIDEHAGFSISPPWGTSTIPNWHYKYYSDFLSNPSVDDSVRKHLLGVDTPSRFFLVDADDLVPISSLRMEDLTIPVWQSQVYTGDKFVGRMFSSKNQVLIFADNWASGWDAELNKKPVEVLRILGTFKGVNISKGSQEIVFRYCPFGVSYYKVICPR